MVANEKPLIPPLFSLPDRTLKIYPKVPVTTQQFPHTPSTQLPDVAITGRQSGVQRLLSHVPRRITQHAHIVQTTLSSAYNITAYAVISPGGSLHVILVNKQNQYAATVEIDTGKLYHSASIIRLSAPSIGATSRITVGGGAVSAQGTWVPLSSESLPLSGTEVKVQVTAGSAASVDLFE